MDEIVTALKKPQLVSVEEYLAGEEVSEVKHEYLGGEVHAMSGGTTNHARIAMNAAISLGSQLRGKPCEPFGSDAKLRVELPHQTRFYYPDLQIVCQPSPGDQRFQEQPIVVVEVLSESTRRTDMGEKKDAYLTISSLKVLLLVETDSRRVSAFRRSGQGGFEAEEYSGEDEVIPLPEVGAELSLSDLYARVDFK
ncbi:Uma2 family endonuclease [Haloferula sp. BvORR071]|uniref:Uma2 family endonuclease n=1 Tax=Haloferula sp. BvORR071 TaxID=1396141 RepID=UPI0006977536|nr:Uma2 family endonuclease [Haloferula sp. BvORR071]